MRKGFTLLELIIVIIIIGILATLGFTQYTKLVERGRTAEAKAILGSIRTAQQAYYLEHGDYTDSLNDLAVEAPLTCTSTHYFRYSTTKTGAVALRCIAGLGGKIPDAPTAYFIILTFADGAWAGSAGYY